MFSRKHWNPDYVNVLYYRIKSGFHMNPFKYYDSDLLLNINFVVRSDMCLYKWHIFFRNVLLVCFLELPHLTCRKPFGH